MTIRVTERNLADIVFRPVITEKATLLLENNQYVFEVDPRAAKPDIVTAIETLFDVKVTNISTMRPPRKKRRVGKNMGHRAQVKRAVVQLAEGDSINLFPEV